MLLTQDQEMIRDAVRDFAQEQLWPHAARWDKEHHFPKEAHQGLAALGAYGICVPEEFGGANLDYVTLALVLYQAFVVRRTASIAINADSLHYKGDLFTNLGVIAAIVLAILMPIFNLNQLVGR